MVDKNDSLLREVEDELRQEQLKKLWTAYGKYVISAAVAFVAGVAIYQQVQSSRIAAAEQAGGRYEAARRLAADNKAAEAAAAFAAIAKDGPAGYAALARLQTAASAVKADKTSDAVAAYDAVAADSNADTVLRDFARMQAAALRLAEADWTEMQNRLYALTDERNSFRASARELLGLAAQKAGRADEARKLYLQVLSDGKSSQALKDRVSGYLSAIVAADIGKAQAPAATPDATAGDPPKK